MKVLHHHPAQARHLGMSLIAQVVLSREILKNLKAKVVKSVGVCGDDDKVRHQALRRFRKLEAVVHK